MVLTNCGGNVIFQHYQNVYALGQGCSQETCDQARVLELQVHEHLPVSGRM